MKSLMAGAAALVAVLTVSCGRLGDRFGSQTYRIPWPAADGSVVLQNVEIPTLSDPEHFSGSSARILVQPADGGDTLAGAAPLGHFARESSGVLVPTDYVTLQAVTTYAHQERLRALDESVGSASWLSWPLSLGLEVRLMSYGQISNNNAVYDAKLNSLLLVPYTESELPMALNAGILGHEHFHFIFQKIVMSRVHDSSTQTSCSGAVTTVPEGFSRPTNSDNEERLEKTASALSPKIYNAYLLRGMNEGFADFYGWLYSQDDTFLAKSLPDQDSARRLDAEPGRLPSEKLVRRLLVDNFHPDMILPEVVRAHNAYALGSIYARYLRHLTDALVKSGRSPSDARLTVARALIASLPQLADVVATSYDNDFLSPNAIVQPLLSHLPPLTRETCDLLESVRAPETAYVAPQVCAKLEPTASKTLPTRMPALPSPAMHSNESSPAGDSK